MNFKRLMAAEADYMFSQICYSLMKKFEPGKEKLLKFLEVQISRNYAIMIEVQNQMSTVYDLQLGQEDALVI